MNSKSYIDNLLTSLHRTIYTNTRPEYNSYKALDNVKIQDISLARDIIFLQSINIGFEVISNPTADSIRILIDKSVNHYVHTNG